MGWNERLEELKEYKDKNGHCNVSTLDENNKKLGNWVMHQRGEKGSNSNGGNSQQGDGNIAQVKHVITNSPTAADKNGKLSQDRIKLLNEIEFE